MRYRGRLTGPAQTWLQHQRWPLWRIGNGLSTVRFKVWWLLEGRHVISADEPPPEAVERLRQRIVTGNWDRQL